jgi:D-glycero-beta-D-manno-heptose 1-phosphate adenylyltransferase
MSNIDFVSHRIYTRETLRNTLGRLRYFKKKIVFTNGCFDIVHLGHIDYLAKAKDCGDFLVVGLNSDASVKLLNKGENRPLQDEKSRSMVIAALGFVDAVILFDEETPYDLISFVQPDVLVKGADYRIDQVAGHDIVRARGGEIRLIELVPGYSTSAVEKKILGGQ